MERACGDRSRAIAAVGLIGDKRAAGPLVAIAGTGADVIHALKQMEALQTLGLDALISTLRSGSYPEGDRLAAVFALKESRDPCAVEALVEVALTDDTSESVRRDAEKAVISMANPHAVALLTAALGKREVEHDTTLDAGKRMLAHILSATIQQLSSEDLRRVARLEDGERTVKCLGWQWDSYNETREWVSGTVPVEFRKERALAKAELARRGTPQ
jgi:HEAT repeat protein